jgi:hypothetical protein
VSLPIAGTTFSIVVPTGAADGGFVVLSATTPQGHHKAQLSRPQREIIMGTRNRGSSAPVTTASHVTAARSAHQRE